MLVGPMSHPAMLCINWPCYPFWIEYKNWWQQFSSFPIVAKNILNNGHKIFSWSESKDIFVAGRCLVFYLALYQDKAQKIRRCRKMSSVIVTKKCTFFENMIWVQTYSVTTEWLWDRALHPSFPQLPRQCSVCTFSSYGRLSTFLPLWLSC